MNSPFDLPLGPTPAGQRRQNQVTVGGVLGEAEDARLNLVATLTTTHSIVQQA